MASDMDADNTGTSDESPSDHNVEIKMNKNQPKIVEIEEIQNVSTECMICSGSFKEPKILSCFHTFCKNCLKEIATTLEKSVGDKLECPTCKQHFLIPEDGIDGLKENHLIEKLIQVQDTLKSSSSNCFCEVCVDGDLSENETLKPEANVYCVDCQQRLCEDCHKYHSRNKFLKGHTVLNLDASQKDLRDFVSTVMTSASEFCGAHGKAVDVYCSDCKDVECSYCFFESHQGHTGENVDSKVNQFIKKIKDNIDVLSGLISQVQQVTQQQESDKIEFIENIIKTEVEIDRGREELKADVDTSFDLLLSKVTTKKQEILKSLDANNHNIAILLSNLEGLKSHCLQIAAMGSPVVISKAASCLDTRFTELQNLCAVQFKRIIKFPRLSLKKKTVEKFVGEIEGDEDSNKDSKKKREEEEGFQKSDKEPMKIVVTAMKQRSFNYMSGVSSEAELALVPKDMLADVRVKALTTLQNALFVAVEAKELVIEIYNLETLNFSRRWRHESLDEVKDMRSCRSSKCLYLLNTTDDAFEIARFKLNGELIKSWSVNNAFGQLSVTDEGNVLLTAWNKSELCEYTADGDLVRKISLTWNNGFEHIWHSVKLDSDRYLVSHGSTEDRFRRLCICDTDGNVLTAQSEYSYDIFTRRILGSPIYMETDPDKYIIVIDSETHNLVVFYTLSEKINSEQTYDLGRTFLPNKISIDENNKRIFLAGYRLRTDKEGKLTVRQNDSVRILNIR